MKINHITTYRCEVCGAEFTMESECRAHEAACYGLTTNEYGIWEVMYKMIAAYKNLLEFEARHRLTTQERPSDWRK